MTAAVRKQSRARAIADVGAGTIFASIEIAAPAERVFSALTNGAEVVKWWGQDGMYWTEEWVMPLEPGKSWRASGKNADGSPFSVEGEIVEVDAPRKLVWTWRAAWDGGHETKITYRLEPIEGGTRVIVRHEGFAERTESCRGHGEGWERVLGWMAGSLAAQSEPTKFFLLRLIPPRPTFPADMRPDEAEAMGAHAIYLRERAAAGTVIAAGPIGDPTAVWGLCLVEVAGEAEARALTEADPVVRSGLGFHYEILPMLSAPILR